MKPIALRSPLAWLFVASLGAPAFALGQALADPTRPPNVTGSDASEAEPPANQLQSLLIAQGRKVAIVNGETVRVGDKVGDALVKNISEAGVVLQYSDHSETLKLLGDVRRRPVRAPRSPGTSGGQGGSRQ